MVILTLNLEKQAQCQGETNLCLTHLSCITLLSELQVSHLRRFLQLLCFSYFLGFCVSKSDQPPLGDRRWHFLKPPGRIGVPQVLVPRVHFHGVGMITEMKGKRLENALDPNQPEDAPVENFCCVSEAHLERVTAGQTHRPHHMFRQPLPAPVISPHGPHHCSFWKSGAGSSHGLQETCWGSGSTARTWEWCREL